MGDIPCHALYKLPEWCVYIETIDKEIEGFWAHLEQDMNDNKVELRFVLMLKDDTNIPLAIHLGDWSVKEGIERMLLEAEKQRKQILGNRALANIVPELGLPGKTVEKISGFMQLVLYLCAENIDIENMPKHPKTRIRRSGQVDIVRKIRTWDVGVRLGATMRKYRNEEVLDAIGEGDNEESQDSPSSDRARPRPHIRRAHWHSFWRGSMDGERELILRWLPPTPVNVKENDDGGIPAVIRKVEK